MAHKENRLARVTQIVQLMDWVGDSGASSVQAAVASFGNCKPSRQMTGVEGLLRQRQESHRKHPNYLLRFDQLFRSMIIDPVNRESMTSWPITNG